MSSKNQNCDFLRHLLDRTDTIHFSNVKNRKNTFVIMDENTNES